MKISQRIISRRVCLNILLLAVMILLNCSKVSAQWANNGSNINNTNTGNVGIGTTAPAEALHLFNTGGSGVGQLELQGGTNNAGFIGYWNFGSLIFSNNRNIRTGNNFNTTSLGAQMILGNSGDNNNGDISFATISSGTVGNWTELLRIKASGNVGVGISNPLYKLDVQNGQINASGGLCIAGACKTSWAQVGGAGTISGVSAGDGLTGGGSTGSVTLTNTDRGSSQFIFKNIANSAGAIQFTAGSNADTLRFTGSGGTTVNFDPAAKKITIDSTASTGAAANIASGQFGQNTGGGNYTFPGNVTVNGTINAKYQDVAEWVPASHLISAGTVVILDPNKTNHVTASAKAYDTRVAGVISETPGITLGEGGNGRVLVATTGRVKVKVDATNAPIAIGDLLVASDVEGFAMKSTPVEIGGVPIHRPGTLIGKALEPLAKGRGEILVLLSLQ